MGAIQANGKNKWRIRIELDRDPITLERNFYRETVTGTKHDANKRVVELEHQLNNGTIINPSNYSVAELMTDWLKDHAKPNTRRTTYDGYAMMASTHIIPALGAIPLHKLQPSHVQSYYTQKLESGLSNRTVKHHHRVLSQAIKYGVGLQRVGRNVCDSVKAPVVKNKEMNPLDEYQVNAFLDSVKDHRFYNFFHLAVNTGMRRSELLGLRWKDIDDLNIYISQVLHQAKGGEIIIEEPKTEKSRRRIDIAPSTALELSRYREYKEAMNGDDLVFTDYKGVPFKTSSISRSFNTALKNLGIDGVRFHDLRHTHATLMLKQNVNPKIIQERLGHSSITVTMDIYGHVMPSMQKDAVMNFADLLKQAREEDLSKVG